MRRTILILVILGLVWIGYLAWPISDLFVLIRALEARDVDAVTRRVYFDGCASRSQIRLPTLMCGAPASHLIQLCGTSLPPVWASPILFCRSLSRPMRYPNSSPPDGA